MEDLNALIGLQDVKDSVKGIANRMVFSKMRQNAGLSHSSFNLHFVFSGNPGTGKTTVARILAQILHNVGYLSKGQIVEVSAREMIGEYVGTTAPKTAAKVTEALGGVLFIDEAYSLMSAQAVGGKSYAGECIATLLKLMEDRRSEFVVIAAGYPQEMRELVNFNPGLSSRFSEFISFPDYDSEELEKIFMKMLTDNEYALAPDALPYLTKVMAEAHTLFDKNFPNARFVRNFYEDCEQYMSNRVTEKFGGTHAVPGTAGLSDLTTLEQSDLEQAYKKQRSAASLAAAPEAKKNPIGFLQNREED
jgi:SpoVK/Ycf46/Vps4 family AAA+-type ATPase